MKKAISAQNTKMYLENPNAAPVATGAVTDASKSAPCYVTFDDASKLKNGAPLYLTGTGWPSLDNQEWVLQNLDPDTGTGALYGSDTTNETADFSSLAMFTVNAFADVCAQSYQINQNPATSIDTTTLCDDEKTSLVGFRDPGTLSFDFFIDPTDPDYLALLEAYDDGEERMFEIIYRNGAVRTLPVIVQSINETGGVDQAVHGTATLKITGQPVLTQPTTTVPPAYGLTVSAAPSTGVAPLPVTLTLTEQNGTASKFVITWGDSTADTTLTGTNAVPPHTYDAAGSYTPSVVATVYGITKPAVQGNAIEVTAA
ncbi:phage tail tube protein [Caballeronia sp. NCTM5]|uniref:phage tail tube protein n=1 Tax=Caballeronia sp. NCTM5 TaxID=2921755 RepID=UPI0020288F74|nr:phage tail tube protein [Caballeronia sp. NCTM5]